VSACVLNDSVLCGTTALFSDRFCREKWGRCQVEGFSETLFTRLL
jgi:hypothetical protein